MPRVMNSVIKVLIFQTDRKYLGHGKIEENMRNKGSQQTMSKRHGFVFFLNKLSASVSSPGNEYGQISCVLRFVSN